MPRSDRFLKACRRQPVDATPVWFMRQAGRYLPEYRALREQHAMLDLIRTPELATRITLQPVNAFEVDAAIIFADILTVLDGMGLGLTFPSGEGPVLQRPIRSAADVERITVRPPEETVGFTLEAIRETRLRLAGAVPLIGFSGAPFTLACYAIEGRSSRDFLLARAFMKAFPDAWHSLMEKLASATGEYLAAQVQAGAQALQLFDTWAGLLNPEEYREYVQPYSRQALRLARRNPDAPIIHFAIRSADLLTQLRDAGGDVIGVDSSTDLADAWRRLGDRMAVQGNLDPDTLADSLHDARSQTRKILDSVRGKPGHIFNLGHGIRKDTPPENVAEIARFVHRHTESPRA
jgi:uroporphyrinogen decarboxylase